MRLYLVKFNVHGYDQYDAFVVVAESPDLAVQVLRREIQAEDDGAMGTIRWAGGYTVEAIEPATEGIILGSFNAG